MTLRVSSKFYSVIKFETTEIDYCEEINPMFDSLPNIIIQTVFVL